MRSRIVAGIAIAALAASGMASSHHSISTIDVSTPVWVKGTVVRYRPGSPHALLEVRAQSADGRTEHWLMEGPFPGRMARIIALYGGSLEAYLQTGDAVEVCGFRPRSSYSVQRTHFVHAQLLLMPDGQMRAWGPYGKLDNCVRARDTVQAWLQFLDRDVLARELWCSGLRNTQTPSVAPETFVEDVNRGLAAPCR